MHTPKTLREIFEFFRAGGANDDCHLVIVTAEGRTVIRRFVPDDVAELKVPYLEVVNVKEKR